LILVDDGSPDSTGEKVAALVAAAPERRRSIVHRENFGRGAAIVAGLCAARAPIAGYLDVDLEIAPRFLPQAVEQIESGTAEWIVARRSFEGRKRSAVRTGLTALSRWTIRRGVGLPVDDPQSGFKVFRRDSVLPFLDRVRDRRWFFDTELLHHGASAGVPIGELPVSYEKRHDASTVRVARDSWRHLVGLWRLHSERRRSRPGDAA